MKYNVLVLGSGGREHAFIHSLQSDDKVAKLYCAPGNGGTAQIAENVSFDIMTNQQVLDFAVKHQIDLTVVGPEAPLANGIVDFFQNAGQKIFGPTQFAAQLESSKIFAREIMDKAGVPQPDFRPCYNLSDCQLAKTEFGFPLVVKADGLAAGKGVIICNYESEFDVAVKNMFSDQIFGDAGESVSIEKCLVGEELSVFAVCDGEDFVILNSAQDHKRAYDNDEGPNTGGMGAYSPTPLSTPSLMKKVSGKIIAPTLHFLKKAGQSYCGFLYVGIMIVNDEPFVIEFNVRMGDPEAQVILPLLESSFFDLLYSTAQGKLSDVDFRISQKTAVAVVLSAKGYPGKYNIGMEISGLEKIESDSLFHAGTKYKDGKYYTTGGRVLNIIGYGDNLKESIRDVYTKVDLVDFDEKFYRRDIGQRGLKNKL